MTYETVLLIASLALAGIAWAGKEPTENVQVIKVKTTTRDVVIKNEQYGMASWKDITTTTEKDKQLTQVLMLKNGELIVKEFNGHWDMEDLKVERLEQ